MIRTVLIFVLVLFHATFFSQVIEKKIALLPIISNGIDESSTLTAESILRMELSSKPNIKILTKNKTLRPLNYDICNDEECAYEIGKELCVDQIILCRLNMLGEKVIVQYMLISVTSGEKILTEQTTALNLEDLDKVMKRVAISIAMEEPFVEGAEVGTVVGNESLESLRRKSRYNFGVGFGYLFPQEGYDNDDKSFTLNAYFDHEINEYAVGLMVGARDGLAINIYGNYLFSNTDVCPYLGTSLGVHWVNHVEDYGYWAPTNTWVEPEKKSANGIELGLKGGVRILHTYNVQLFINVEYTMTFNDYKDKAIVFTIGIL